MQLFTVIALLLSTQAQATSLDIAKDIIGMYQPEVRARYKNAELSLKIKASLHEPPNAQADRMGKGGTPMVTIFSAMLKMAQGDLIIIPVCHEVGHFLGNTRLGFTAGGLAFEGESDYFAGKCAARYYQQVRGYPLSVAQKKATEMAKSFFQYLYETRLNENYAHQYEIAGISQGYPEPECRILSVIHGAMAWKRPACWYNPN